MMNEIFVKIFMWLIPYRITFSHVYLWFLDPSKSPRLCQPCNGRKNECVLKSKGICNPTATNNGNRLREKDECSNVALYFEEFRFFFLFF